MQLHGYEERNSGGNKDDKSGTSLDPSAIPSSYNPVIRLKWTTPEKLFFETAYGKLPRDDPYHYLSTLASRATQSASGRAEVRAFVDVIAGDTQFSLPTLNKRFDSFRAA